MILLPQLGASASAIASDERVAASPHRRNGQFVNPRGVVMEMSAAKGMSALKEMLTSEGRRPKQPLPTAFGEGETGSLQKPEEFAVTWFGHSAVMLEIDGLRLLIDPMLSASTSPFPFIGKRFALRESIDIDRIPDPDAVLISHDHYDHLDYESIRRLAPRTGHFYAPLGVGAHLREWDVPDEQITEVDWWDETTVSVPPADEATPSPLRIIAAPARHFSGRGLRDRNATLWTSWIIIGRTSRIFFSGDSGYGPHFREIGERFGPFDFTMMECGQYNESWHAIHSMPEESVQAHRDLRGAVMMPIHWGAFTLAPHHWTDPVERALAAASQQGVRIALPRTGERFIPSRSIPTDAWWDVTTR